MTNSFSKALLRHDIFVTQQDFFFFDILRVTIHTHTATNGPTSETL